MGQASATGNPNGQRSTLAAAEAITDNFIPNDCLALIFHSLSTADRNRCSFVCRRWHRIEGQSRHRLSLNAQSDLSPLIPSLFSRFDSVTNLTLRCHGKSLSIGDEALVLISHRCPNLTLLKLRACRELTNAGIETFAKNCKGLKKFSCGSCSFGSKGMNALIDNCVALEELSVIDLNGISEPICGGAAESSLKSICLKELQNGDCFFRIILGAKNLKRLKLSRCYGDWDKLFHLLVVAEVASVVEIHLEKLQISDIGLKAISNFCNLETLHLLKTPWCSEEGLAEVAEGCKHLEELHIWNVNRMGDEGLIAVAKCCPNLKKLVLVDVNPTEESLEMLASNCKSIELFSLCASVNVGDREICCIVKNALR